MTAWLIAYDSVQGRMLACYEQEAGESIDDFHARAQKVKGIWFRLRPSTLVEMRRAGSFAELVQNNPDFFSTASTAPTIGNQRRSVE